MPSSSLFKALWRCVYKTSLVIKKLQVPPAPFLSDTPKWQQGLFNTVQLEYNLAQRRYEKIR